MIARAQTNAAQALIKAGHPVVDKNDMTKAQRAGKIHLYTVLVDEVKDRLKDNGGIAFNALTQGKTVWKR
ncbi:MAG: hypothetical protein U0946_07265 [Patescibacteria group bacterium]|nr:hypothetical protein [Patescibacteria group bacterium]